MAVLVLRAWVENRRQLRVRITHVVGRTSPRVTAASNVEGTCAIVQAWLEDFLDAIDHPSQGPTWPRR
jgi:hypothetical protein